MGHFWPPPEEGLAPKIWAEHGARSGANHRRRRRLCVRSRLRLGLRYGHVGLDFHKLGSHPAKLAAVFANLHPCVILVTPNQGESIPCIHCRKNLTRNVRRTAYI